MATFDKIKGISIASEFKLQAETPLDGRLVVDTIADRDALVTEHGAYEGMTVYVKADRKSYRLKGTTNDDWTDEEEVDVEIDGEAIPEADGTEIGYRFIVAGGGQSDPAVEWCKKENGQTTYGSDTGFYFRLNSSTGAFESGFDDTFLGKFTRTTDAKNNVMVKVPKYFIKEEFVGVYQYVWFCEVQKEGYRPAEFLVRPDGTIADYVLVGAYEMGNLSPGRSISGAAYSDDNMTYMKGYTRAQYRTEAKKNGAGYGLRTVALTCDLFQKLMTLEFGTRDTQKYAAGICVLIEGPHDEYYPELAYRTGMTDNVPNLNGIYRLTDNVPDGELYNYNKQTGLNCGANPFVWRGFENPYGCLEEYDDGLNFHDGEAYVTNVQAAMADDTTEGYEKLSYPVYSGYGYIISQGYDPEHPWASLPTYADESAASMTYYTDDWEGPNSSGYCASSVGGCYYNRNGVGVFARYAYYQSTIAYSYVGSRLFYLPPSETA